MKDFRLYDFEFNLLYIENECMSAEWYFKYNGIGTFEGHFKLNGERIRILDENPYIVIIQGDYQAIITGRQIIGNELILYGRTVNWLLSKRVTPKFSTYRLDIGTNAEDIARWAVKSAFADVDNFVLADRIGLEYSGHFWRNVYNPTSDVIADCLKNAGAGHRLVFDRDTKTWIFSIYKGTQNPLTISVGNKTAYSMVYDEDLQDYCSGGWYEASEGEEGNSESESIWKNISNDDGKTGIYRWESVISASSESEVRSILKKREKTKDCQLKSSGVRYGVDYNLGDTVRVQYEYGDYKVSKKQRISGVRIWLECANEGQLPTFEEPTE